MSFYDLNWYKLGYLNKDIFPKPKNLKLLIELDEKLDEGFPHVTVDFYILNDSSIKKTSLSGECKWNPPKQNKILGELIQLSQKRLFPSFQ